MATNYARASFSEVYDMHTEAGHPAVIGVHTPTSNVAQKMLMGFFSQFRKYKYTGASITFVPVSTLPADPLQISYEAGEPTIDPRDMVNPILFKGVHGESLGAVLDALVPNNTNGIGSSVDIGEISPAFTIGPSDEDLVTAYYQALSDPSWSKAGVQSGFRRKNLYPLVHSLALNQPLLGEADAFTSYGNVVEGNTNLYTDGFDNYGVSVRNADNMWEHVRPQIFTSGFKRLGWIPTFTTHSTQTSGSYSDASTFVALPKCMMLLIMLPPSYKTEFYFRVVLTHHFEFRDFTAVMSPSGPYFNDGVLPAYNDGGATASTSSLDMTSGSATLVTTGVS